MSLLLKSKYLTAIVLYILLLGALQVESTCSSHQVMCPGSRKCIYHSDFCNGISDCPPQFLGGVYGLDYDNPKYFDEDVEFCNRHGRVCEPCKTHNEIGKEFAELLSQAVMSSNSSTSCPVLYTRIGGECVSFFTPAKISWDASAMFCKTLKGVLFQTSNVTFLAEVQNYLQKNNFKSDFWIGGKSNISSTNGLKDNSTVWTWTDDSLMDMGTPFWALSYTEFCKENRNKSCYHQLPKESSIAKCASMDYERFYYIGDNPCEDQKSALCIYDHNL